MGRPSRFDADLSDRADGMMTFVVAAEHFLVKLEPRLYRVASRTDRDDGPPRRNVFFETLKLLTVKLHSFNGSSAESVGQN